MMFRDLEHPEIGWIERTGHPSQMQEDGETEVLNDEDDEDYDSEFWGDDCEDRYDDDECDDYCDYLYDERREHELFGD